VFVYSTPGAASCELAVDDDCWKTADAVLFRAVGDLVLMHVMHLDFMLRTRELLDHIDRFSACRTTCAENLDFVFHVLILLLFFVLKIRRCRARDFRSSNF
jgi:hypothetical protein